MPTYQYACTECDHSFEQFQSFSDDALTVCPRCQGRLRKKFNAVGVVFKGSGFYRNDSRSPDPNGKPVKAEKSGSSSGESAGESGGDKKSSPSSTEKTAGTSDTSTKKAAPKDSPTAA